MNYAHPSESLIKCCKPKLFLLLPDGCVIGCMGHILKISSHSPSGKEVYMFYEGAVVFNGQHVFI